ncbi:Putrescine aminotransferase [Gossypium arboreum]|uniref:Putrescine aminotransferase n=1 Tax=Gossypium arboreum TaxID=29729 RepID=A0A0B0NZ05_GOSAR|nr:Putrescine aminotransferase [Gossypium arboreum]
MLSVKLDDDACNDGLSTLDSRAKRATIGQGEGKGDRIAEKAVRQHPRLTKHKNAYPVALALSFLDFARSNRIWDR